jgi:hypothetical protein
MSVMLSAVVFMLGASWLAYATHESSSSSYDRRRQQAVDAANAGLVAADAALSRSAAHAGVGVTSFPGGSAQYEVAVAVDPTAPTGFRRVITAIGYAPSKTATDKVVRTIRQVVDLDPLGFQFAMFSESSILTGSSSTVIGDIYSVTNITLGNSQDYIGSVYSLGTIATGSNQKITGNLNANGGIGLTSSSTDLLGSAYSGGNIVVNGTVRDTAQAAGTISNCARVSGTCLAGTAPPAVPVQGLPTFVWNASNYPAVTYGPPPSKVNTQGVFYVAGNLTLSKNDTLWLTGNTTIDATGDVTLPGNIENRSAGGASLQLTVVSTGTAPSGTIAPSNNFTIPSTVKTLMYTKGVFNAGNSSTFTGSLYAGSLSSGAHIAVTYAPLDDTGFDWTSANPQTFTIRNVSTREIVNGT